MGALDYAKREAFGPLLWHKTPSHLHDIDLDFENALWVPADIDALADLWCKYENRFSQNSRDLGHVTAESFRIILKNDTRPV